MLSCTISVASLFQEFVHIFLLQKCHHPSFEADPYAPPLVITLCSHFFHSIMLLVGVSSLNLLLVCHGFHHSSRLVPYHLHKLLC